jgi:hypothetical protein
MKQLMMTIIFVMAATNGNVQPDSTASVNQTVDGEDNIKLTVSYRFGKLKASVKKTETTIDNDDVVGGISKGK